MKGFIIIGLGLLIWGLSLLWPDLNRILTEPVMLKLSVGLGAMMFVYEIIQHLVHHRDNHQPKEHSTHHRHNSHPVPRVLPR